MITKMKTVFLDRDGTVIVDPQDLRVESISEIKLFPDSIKALEYFADNGFAIIFITNQAGIGEGLITEGEFWEIHDEVLKRIEPSGATILETYMDGESESPDASEWRKPGPKMLLQAAEDHNLKLSEIYMVGDNKSDIKAAINAGCKGGILVKTANVDVESPDAIHVAPNLLEAAKYIVANS